MRLQGVEAIAVDIPLRRNFGGSTYAVLKRSTVVTRLRTDDGLVSEVYNGDNREHGPAIAHALREDLGPLLRGQDPANVETLWPRPFALSHGSRDRKLLMEAVACVDCALWDLVGKARGQAVCALLGGTTGRRLPIVSIGGYYREGKTLADIGREMEAYRAAGMAGCKFKGGGLPPEDDARRVGAARRGAGRDPLRFARLVQPLDVRWFEEPCHWYDDVALMAEVRRATRIPVTAGQSEITAHGVRRLLDARAVDIVNVDASECGGVTEWQRAAAMCGV